MKTFLNSLPLVRIIFSGAVVMVFPYVIACMFMMGITGEGFGALMMTLVIFVNSFKELLIFVMIGLLTILLLEYFKPRKSQATLIYCLMAVSAPFLVYIKLPSLEEFLIEGGMGLVVGMVISNIMLNKRENW